MSFPPLPATGDLPLLESAPTTFLEASQLAGPPSCMDRPPLAGPTRPVAALEAPGLLAANESPLPQAMLDNGQIALGQPASAGPAGAALSGAALQPPVCSSTTVTPSGTLVSDPATPALTALLQPTTTPIPAQRAGSQVCGSTGSFGTPEAGPSTPPPVDESLALIPMHAIQEPGHVPAAAPASSTATHDALDAFVLSVQRGLNPVLQPPPRRRRREIPPDFTPRRSHRIAQADCGLDSEMKAKRVLLRRLGLLHDDEPVDPVALDKYAKLFERPLAPDVLQAFADFYGWDVPVDGVLPTLAPSSPGIAAA